MGDREVRWLRQELPRLVERGVLAPEAAQRLAAHYGEPAAASSRLAILLFGTLGAALCGGGVILLLAHNWDVLSRPLRAAVALAPLLAAQALAGWVVARRRDVPAWTEPAGVLLGAALFSAVALVGQTYQVPGGLDDYLLGCALLVLPAVYLLDVPRVLLAGYVAAIVGWSFAAADEAGAAFWLLAAAAAPAYALLVRRGREWWLLGLGTALAGIVATARLARDGGLWAPALAGLLALCVVAGRVPRLFRAAAPADPRWTAPFALAGRAGLPILALVLTFDVLRTRSGGTELAGGVTAGLAALGGAAALACVRGAVRERRWFEVLAAAAPLPAWIAWAGGGGEELLFNAYLLALGVGAIADGLAGLRLAALNFGLAIVAVHASVRFFDEDLSFLVRGVSFILVGLAFVGLNAWLLRRRREVRA